MKINHAILHVFDFVSCVNVYAQEELDLASKNAKRYVTSHAKKALGNMDSKRGEFAEDSMFAEELRAYFRGQRGFVDLSVQVAEFIAGELGRMEKSESADLLVLDFEDDPDTTVRAMDDEEALPARVVVEKSVAKRVAKSHKIRTDTGIDITFPAEYGENPDFIEFVSGPNGLINIELKNIGHIENR